MVETSNLNQAAMLMTLGGKLIQITDTSPRCNFKLKVRLWQLWYEKYVGIVSYRKFCKARVELKTLAYQKSGRIPVFSGKKDGFIFNDVVRIVPFNKREKDQYRL